MAPSKEEPTFDALDGFTAVPVQFSDEEAAHHCFYVKESTQWDKTLKNRTLLVINIPGYITEKGLSDAFSSYGQVQSVELLSNPRLPVEKDAESNTYFNQKTLKGFREAYVTLKKESGKSKFGSQAWTSLVVSKKDNFIKAGIHKWIEDYEKSFTNVSVLQAEIDQFMEQFDKKEEEKEEKSKEEEGVPDETGWITVTRKGRRPGTVRTETMHQRLVEKEKKKRAQKELLNFYAWQQRNKTKEHLNELRKKFEEDKQKIALMRAQRKFRPY